MTPIPFVDLHAQYLTIRDEVDAAIARVIAASSFIRGPDVEAFEAEYAAAAGAQHCVSCANGTDALYIAMKALGVKPGDEVITTAQSWIATSETVSQHGAQPVFVDIDPATSNIDPALIAAKISPRTVGIIPVHFNGLPADMAPIMALAVRHGLWVIEDCAQAHLATYRGRPVGAFGQAATWSFYPGKNLGAMGDAGAITTSDAALARHMAMFARHGGITKGDHQIEGINSRLDGLQAAVLRIKLRRLAGWTERRQALAARYQDLLAGAPGLDVPSVPGDCTHVWHMFALQLDGRDAMAAHLASRGVGSGVNYPRALPFLPAYARLGHTPSDFPNAHRQSQRVLALPMFAELTAVQQDRIAEAVLEGLSVAA
jgi:dTDP-4-amino-4,6-dideoxygalactose transaminase